MRRAMKSGLAATIYRPGVVVGDSETGETQKYDGPYFLAGFMRKQLSVAFIPAVGDADKVRFGLVPRDYVIDAMDALSVMDKSLAGPTRSPTRTRPPRASSSTSSPSTWARRWCGYRCPWG